MTWYLRDTIEPAFDSPLTKMKFISGGVYVVKTRQQRNNIKAAYRKLSNDERTLVAVTDDKILYALVNNPTTESTQDSDWENFLDPTGTLVPIGEWQNDNSNPVLTDAGAQGLNGQFYFVTGAPTGYAFQDPNLFNGEAITVYDGDWVISVGDYWAHVRPTSDWSSLNRPQSIIDYENGIVQAHTHPISDVINLQTELDSKFDSSDVGDITDPWVSIPSNALIDKQLVDLHIYRKEEVYNKAEVDNLITGTSFIDLPDTPSVYTGAALRLLRVNGTADAVEFVDGSTLFALSSHTHVKADVTDFADTDYIQTGANSQLASNIEIDGQTLYDITFKGTALKALTDVVNLTFYETDDITTAVRLGANSTDYGELYLSGAGVDMVQLGGNQAGFIDNGYAFGIGTALPQADVTLHLGGTGGLIVPIGTSLERPSPTSGIIRFNTDNTEFEGYDGTGWTALGAGAGGSSNFLGLTDTPTNYSGANLQAVRVNTAGNALEFVDVNTLIGGGSLAGGLINQILVKQSATDYDYIWQDPTFKLNIDANTGVGFTGDIGTDTDEALISFRNETANNLSAGLTDIYVGPGHPTVSAYGNVAIGQGNLASLTPTGEFSGGRNHVVGWEAGASLTTGTHNILMGRRVLNSATDTSYSLFMGYEAALNGNPGASNYIISQWGMRDAVADGTYTADFNVALGVNVFRGAAQIGTSNTGIGPAAFQDPLLITNDNIGIGDSAFRSTTFTVGKGFNIGVGPSVYRDATVGENNAVVGVSGFRYMSAGDDNTGLGRSVGWKNAGNRNTFVGYRAGFNSGINYTTGAGGVVLTGADNTFIGYEAGYGTAALTGTIVIGNTIEANSNNKVYLGGSTQDVILGKVDQDDLLTKFLVVDANNEIHWSDGSAITGFPEPIDLTGALDEDLLFRNAGTWEPTQGAFTWDPANYAIIAGQSPSHTTEPRWSLLIGQTLTTVGIGSGSHAWNIVGGSANQFDNGGTFRSFADSLMIGTANTVRIANGSFGVYSSMMWGESNLIEPAQSGVYIYSNVGGTRNISRHSLQHLSGIDTDASGLGAFVHAEGHTTNNIYADGRYSAVFASKNTASQTLGHGANAENSVIIGAEDANIPSDSPRSIILGGQLIKAAAATPDMVYVPNIRLEGTLTQDDTETQIAAIDSVTNQIVWRDASTIAPTNYWVTDGVTNLGADSIVNTGEYNLRIRNTATFPPKAIIIGNSDDTTAMTYDGTDFTFTLAGTEKVAYTADYSANFSDRSFADWGNVWKVKGNTNITNSQEPFISIDSSGGTAIHIREDDSASSSEFFMGGFAGMELISYEGTGYTGNSARFSAVGGDWLFNDATTSPTGLRYGGDYSSGFDDRSLIDKGYADGAYWKVSGTTALTEGADVLVEMGTQFVSDYVSITFDDTPRRLVFGAFDSILSTTMQHLIENTKFEWNDNGTIAHRITGGQNLFANGTEAAPSVVFISDDQTGFYAPSSDTIGVVVNQNEMLRYTTTGISLLANTEIDRQEGESLTFTHPHPDFITTFTEAPELHLIPGVAGFRYWRNDTTFAEAAMKVTSNTSFVFTQDSNNPGTMEYAADYSANYSNRSLIDKGYADGAYVATEGITNVATTGGWTVQGDGANTMQILSGVGAEAGLSIDGDLLGGYTTLYGWDGDSILVMSSALNSWSVYSTGTANPSSKIQMDVNSVGIYASDVTSVQTAIIVNQSGSITAQRSGGAAWPGIEYNTDLSANYTDRSLPDWGNVWRSTADTTLQSGADTNVLLPDTGGSAELRIGLNIDNYRTTLNDFSGLIVDWSGVDNYNSSLSSGYYSTIGADRHEADFSVAHDAGNDATSVYMRMRSGNDLAFIYNQTVISPTDGFEVHDNITNIGLSYGADYSTAGASLGDRWIPDKGYVDTTVGNYISLGSGDPEQVAQGDIIIQGAAGQDFEVGWIDVPPPTNKAFDNIRLGANTAIVLGHYSGTTITSQLTIGSGAFTVNSDDIDIVAQDATAASIFMQADNTTVNSTFTIVPTAISLTSSADINLASSTGGSSLSVSGMNLDMNVNSILDADRVGLNLTTGDVATPLEGQIWYNNTTNKFRANENGSNVDLIVGGWNLTGTTDLTGSVFVDRDGASASTRYQQTDAGITITSYLAAGHVNTSGFNEIGVNDEAGVYLRNWSVTPFTDYIHFEIDSGFATFEDTWNGHGIKYVGDYSATFQTRSLVDKGFIEGSSASKLDRVGLNLTTGDVTTPLEGQIWYNNTTNKFRANENGVAVDIIGGGGETYFDDNYNGTAPSATGTDALAIGESAVANSTTSIAIGQSASATNQDTIAIGTGAEANNLGVIAIGQDAGDNTTGTDGFWSLTIGYGANSTPTRNIGQSTVAIGYAAHTPSQGQIAIGDNAGNTSGTTLNYGISIGASSNFGSHNMGIYDIAIGYQSWSVGGYSVNIGYRAGNTSGTQGAQHITIGRDAGRGSAGTSNIGADAILIGNEAEGTVANVVVIGYRGSATGSGGIAIGNGAEANAADAIAMGTDAGDNTTGTDGDDSISIGNQANSVAAQNIGNRSIAIGYLAESTGTGSIAIGDEASAADLTAMAIGDGASATGSADIAIGVAAATTGLNAIAIGNGADGDANNIVSIGSNAGSTSGTVGASAVVIGQNAGGGTQSIGASSVMIGVAAKAQNANSIAIGLGTLATADDAISMGNNTLASGADSVAIGNLADATGSDSIAIGDVAQATASNAIAIGPGAEAEQIGTVAIGFNAADTTGTTNAYSISIGYDANSGASNIGSQAIAIGYQADSIGNESVAVGDVAVSSASASVAVGKSAQAQGTTGSIALGAFTTSSASQGISLGYYAQVSAVGAIMIGTHSSAITNDRTDSFALGWDESIPSMWIEKYTATTTGIAGTATIDIPLDASSSYIITADIVGGETDASPTMYAAAKLEGGWYRNGSGNVTSMSSVMAGESALGTRGVASAAANTENVGVSWAASTTNVRITLTGPDTTSTAMAWRVLIRMSKVVST